MKIQLNEIEKSKVAGGISAGTIIDITSASLAIFCLAQDIYKNGLKESLSKTGKDVAMSTLYTGFVTLVGGKGVNLTARSLLEGVYYTIYSQALYRTFLPYIW